MNIAKNKKNPLHRFLTLLFAISTAITLSSCQQITENAENLKSTVRSGIDQAGTKFDETKKAVENTAQDLSKKATETKDAIDTKVKQIDDAAKAINDASISVSEAKKKLDAAVK